MVLVRTGSEVGVDEGRCSPTRARARGACRLSRITPAGSTPATPAIAAKEGSRRGQSQHRTAEGVEMRTLAICTSLLCPAVEICSCPGAGVTFSVSVWPLRPGDVPPEGSCGRPPCWLGRRAEMLGRARRGFPYEMAWLLSCPRAWWVSAWAAGLVGRFWERQASLRRARSSGRVIFTAWTSGA